MSGITVLEKPEGAVEEQDMYSFGPAKWKDNNQLWWTGKLGAKMKLGIRVKNDGEFELYTRLTKAPDYGIVQFYLDDTKLGEPIDLFNKDKVIITEELNLGKVHLTPGAHVLTVEIVGANPEAIKMYMFGMDYLHVKPL